MFTLDIKCSHTQFPQISYFIFKTYEPSSPPALSVLLGVVPTALAVILRREFSSPLIAVLTVSSAYYSLLVAFTIAYRLSPLHPLAKYPGPLIGKVSKGWLAYVAGVRGDTHTYVQNLHKLHGDVVRIGNAPLRPTCAAEH